ncbi:hypothetical protein [Nonomuraea sp. NPDC050786]|uniref:hypothetical protein n=1 Tax=Nonomuraea sp. NPDC050786 TaxID=3154840 RepID=UPI0033FF8750
MTTPAPSAEPTAWTSRNAATLTVTARAGASPARCRNRACQPTAIDDVGAFAALAFAGPGTYMGEAVEITGDWRTSSQIAEALSAAAGRPAGLTPHALPGIGRPASAISAPDFPSAPSDSTA